MYDIIIIGMGIAGITSGIYAARAGLKVLMFEKDTPGGILKQLTEIKNYPGYTTVMGPDLALELFNQVKELNIPFKMEEVLSLENSEEKKLVRTSSGEYEAKNVIIATGRKPKFLGLDNEKDYLGKGVSTCAVCDGALYKGKDVCIVGSGNSALSECLYLSNIANKVYLLHRGTEFKGDAALIEKVKSKENVVIKDCVNVSKINETDGKISSVDLDNGENLIVEGIFIYIGYRPDTDMFKDLNILNINGDVIVDENMETTLEGIYAVGDCNKKDLYQLVTAAADGAIAASNIEKIGK